MLDLKDCKVRDKVNPIEVVFGAIILGAFLCEIFVLGYLITAYTP